MYKISKYAAIALGAVAVVLFGGLVYSDIDPYTMLLFYISYILLALAVIAVLAYGLMNLLSSPQKMKKTLLYTGVFVAIIAISYALASGENATEKWVGTGITAFFILGAIATGLMILSGVKSALVKS
ncbi:MAG: hypothetical protein Q4G08_04310 [Capnocytophaga sp.]|nr:hypothetical protein [Capnocytophaga sp.]